MEKKSKCCNADVKFSHRGGNLVGWECKKCDNLCDLSVSDEGKEKTNQFKEELISFIEHVLSLKDQEWQRKVEEIHTLLHNGKTEESYRLVSKLLKNGRV